MEASKKTIELINEDFDDFDDAEKLKNFLNNYVGTHQHAMVGLYSYFGFNKGAFGIMFRGFAQGTLDAEVINPAVPYLETDYI